VVASQLFWVHPVHIGMQVGRFGKQAMYTIVYLDTSPLGCLRSAHTFTIKLCGARGVPRIIQWRKFAAGESSTFP